MYAMHVTLMRALPSYMMQFKMLLAFKNAGCRVVNKPTVEDEDGKTLIPDHLILGNGTQSGQGLMIDYCHTESRQTQWIFQHILSKATTRKKENIMLP
jgi:hypothetical protein